MNENQLAQWGRVKITQAALFVKREETVVSWYLPQILFCAKRDVILGKERKERVKFVAPPKEMLLSFSIVWFLTNYDVTNRKQ